MDDVRDTNVERIQMFQTIFFLKICCRQQSPLKEHGSPDLPAG